MQRTVGGSAPSTSHSSPLRLLLQDRFQFAAHTEQRTQAIFDLGLARPGRTGPQLRAHQTDATCAPPIEPQFTTLGPP